MTCPADFANPPVLELVFGASPIAGGLVHPWAPVIEELRRIRNLKDDWDGEGAEAPQASLVDGAISLARTLEASGHPPAERVIASVNGTVYFEWHTPSGYLEIEVFSPSEAEGRWVKSGSDRATVFSLPCRP